MNPNALYSMISIISALAVGLIIFISCRKNFSAKSGSFFKSYAAAFSILGFGFLFHFFINSGLAIQQSLYTAIFIFSQGAIVMAHLLFYRGTVALDTNDRFRTVIFPLVALPSAFVLTVFGLLMVAADSFVMLTVIRWGFIIPLKTFLASIFLYYFVSGSRFNPAKWEPYKLLFGLVWLISLSMDIYHWFTVASYPQDFWAMKLAGMTGWYILRAAVYWLTLVAVLLYSRHLNRVLTDK